MCYPNGLHKNARIYQHCGMSDFNPQDTQLKKAIAERIRELRERTGLTQSEFASKHEIDRQLLNRWESINNRRGITIYTIRRFCSMIDISLSEFFNSRLFG